MMKHNRATIFAALVCTILLLSFMPTVLAALPQNQFLPLVLIAEPTETNTPSPTPTITPVPGLGAATGRILWGGQPYAGVTVKLCQTWAQYSGGCQTQVYSADSGTDGRYTITAIPAGKYHFSFKVPGQTEYSYLTGAFVTVVADQIVTIRDENIVKLDLNLISPIDHETVTTTKPTLTWEAYPGADYYYVSVYNNDTYKSVAYAKVNTSQYTIPTSLAAGEYYWSIYAYNAAGIKIAESRFHYYFVVAP